MPRHFRLLYVILMVFSSIAGQAQSFYLKGQVRDERGTFLPNVKITVLATGYTYLTGGEGDFGFMISREKDSVSFSLPGYETLYKQVNAKEWNLIILRRDEVQANRSKRKLSS